MLKVQASSCRIRRSRQLSVEDRRPLLLKSSINIQSPISIQISTNCPATFSQQLLAQCPSRFTLHDRKAVLKNNDCQRYQTSSLYKLQGCSTTPFKIRCYGRERPICLGVITGEKKRHQFTCGKGTVAYWTGKGKGKVQVQGEEGTWKERMFLHYGDVLLMEVDQYDMKIIFILQQSQRTFQYFLPASFKDKELCPFLNMASLGHTVQILL